MAKAGNVDYELSLNEGDVNMPLNQFYFAEDQQDMLLHLLVIVISLKLHMKQVL